MKIPLTVVLFVLVALCAASCRALGESPPKPDWVEREFTAPSENVMWEVVRRSLSRMGFPQGAGMDHASLAAESGWRTQPSVSKDKGFRLRAIVEIDPQGDQRYLVRSHVQKQKNTSIVNPSDPTYAEWKWEPDDVESARLLIQHMRTYLDTTLELGS